MHYEFYVDVYVMTNFFFDYLALLAVRELRTKQTAIGRLLLAAMGGAVCATLILLLSNNAVWYPIVVHCCVNPLMLYLCFRQKKGKDFLIDYLMCYILIFLLGGMVNWLRQKEVFRESFLLVLAAVSVMLTVVLILYHIAKEEEKRYEIRIRDGENEVTVTAFYDTGNRLTDPYLKLPVSLIGEETLQKLKGETEWKYRYIPFVSLGKKHGLVKAVTLEAMYVHKKKKDVEVKPAVFAVVEDEFLKDDEYQVILNGRL